MDQWLRKVEEHIQRHSEITEPISPERHRRFDRFIRAWCTNGLPGTIPCFQGLYGIMRLQQLPETLGGAGGNRIDWEIDDAVFMEAA